MLNATTPRRSLVGDRFTIVATLGPASLERASGVVEAGATALRLNTSHMDPGGVRRALASIRSACPTTPVALDLQGAKMRLGDFEAREIRQGDTLVFGFLDAGSGAVIPLPHQELFAAARPGDTVSVEDGRLRFRILEVDGRRCRAEALGGGRLLSRRGVNIAEHPVELSDLAARDAAFCDVAAEVAGVAIAFSFMKTGLESAWVRRRVPGGRVIGKIERREAAERMAEIAGAVEEIWICRGDLGAQLGPAALARFVASVDPRATGRPVLMAGQVVQSLVDAAEPTRSEVCHLFDLVSRGYSGVVLSDETAIGRHPELAVRAVRSLVDAFRGEEQPNDWQSLTGDRSS